DILLMHTYSKKKAGSADSGSGLEVSHKILCGNKWWVDVSPPFLSSIYIREQGEQIHKCNIVAFLGIIPTFILT
ncbi:MAG: hypothetical protein AAF655_25455, partial [Bacteroidota bacterium]